MSKTLIWLGLFVGSTVGGYVPSFFGADTFSVWSIIGGTVGAIVGAVGGYQLATRWGL